MEIVKAVDDIPWRPHPIVTEELLVYDVFQPATI